MEQLTDDHLTHLVDVLASDLVFKRDFLIKIRAEEVLLQTPKTSSARESSSCAVCSKPLEVFNRQTDCSQCSRRVCSNCHHDKICKFCLAQRDLEKKWKQFKMICPFARNQFGYAKLACDNQKALDKRRTDSITWSRRLCTCRLSCSPAELMQRAKLEMHLTHQLGADLDTCNVMISVKDPKLEKSRRRLVNAVRQYGKSVPFNQIDDAVEEIKRHRIGDGSVLESEGSARHGTYSDLLSLAVVSSLVRSSIASPSELPSAILTAPSTSAAVALPNSLRRTTKMDSTKGPTFDGVAESSRSKPAEKIRPREAWQSKSATSSSQKVESYPRCVCERRRELERVRRQLQQVVETNLMLTRTNQQLLDMVDELLRRAFASKQHVRSIRTRQISREEEQKMRSDSLEN